jgi:hypothetical protein
LTFSLPGLIEFYYIQLQKLNPQDLQLVRWTAVSLIFFPFSVAIRAQSEGLAAWQKNGVPGHLIGPVGLTLGSLASSATMRIFLKWSKERAIPVGQTTTSVGQIR